MSEPLIQSLSHIIPPGQSHSNLFKFSCIAEAIIHPNYVGTKNRISTHSQRWAWVSVQKGMSHKELGSEASWTNFKLDYFGEASKSPWVSVCTSWKWSLYSFSQELYKWGLCIRNGNSDAQKKNQTCHYPNTKDPELEHWKGGSSKTQTKEFRGPVRPTSSHGFCSQFNMVELKSAN